MTSIYKQTCLSETYSSITSSFWFLIPPPKSIISVSNWNWTPHPPLTRWRNTWTLPYLRKVERQNVLTIRWHDFEMSKLMKHIYWHSFMNNYSFIRRWWLRGSCLSNIYSEVKPKYSETSRYALQKLSFYSIYSNILLIFFGSGGEV